MVYIPSILHSYFRENRVSHQWKNVVNNENGSAIVLAMLILVVLTVLGIASINTSSIELQIARNERIYQQNFYQAESAATEGAQKIEDSGSLDVALAQTWCKKSLDDDDYDDDDSSDTDDPGAWTDADPDDSLGLDATVSVVLKGIVGSIDMTSEVGNKYKYAIRGYGKANNGKVLIEIGYKIRH